MKQYQINCMNFLYNNLIIKKMKKFLLLSGIAVFTSGAFISCNQNNIEEPYNKRAEAEFSSNIIKIEQPKGRAAGEAWEESDSIGIFMLKETSTDIVESKSNIKYVTDQAGKVGKFTAAGEIIYFPDNGEKVRFMSYYPYKNGITDTYNVSVLTQTNQAAIDLLYSFDDQAIYDKTTEDRKVTLNFEHQLSKVNIYVKRGDDLSETYLNNLTVQFAELNTLADFDLMTGDLSITASPETITTKEVSTINDYEKGYVAIILPEDPTADANMIFNINNGDGDSIEDDIFTWIFTNDIEFKQGKEYTFLVTIKRSGIVVDATIKDWVNGGPDKEIDAE